MLFDLFAVFLVIIFVYFLRFKEFSSAIFFDHAAWLISLTVLIGLYIFGTYDLDREPSVLKVVTRTLLAIFFGFGFVVLFYYIFAGERVGVLGRGVLIGSMFLFGSLAAFYRAVVVQFFDRFSSEFSWLLLIEDHSKSYFKDDFEKWGGFGQVTYLTEKGNDGKARWSDLDSYLNRRWSGVIYALSADRLGGDVAQQLVRAKLAGHNVIGISQFYERHWLKVPVFALSSEWFIAAESFKLVNDPISIRVKRLTDMLLSTVLLATFWPVMLLVSLAIKLEGKGPVIYRQTRTGKDGRHFTIYKFRSMINNAESCGAKWADVNDSRITRVGKLIRLTRLDELPQLLNVFKGDMSFVGPRPERPEFNQMLEAKIPYYDLRHLVRPGITGWAQVSYPYGASLEDAREKLQYDIYYVKYYSLILDFLIVLRTVRVILFGQGR